MDDDIRPLRIDLAAALRWAARLGLHEGICNHFSVAVSPAGDRFLVNPMGWHWREITASSLVLADADGRVLEGDNQVERSALCIHSPIHLARPRAHCVLHTHMPYATSLTLLDDPELKMVEQNALRFHDRIAYDMDYNGVANDTDEGDRMAAMLGDRDVLFLSAHGVIVTGPTIHDAFDDLYYLERACQFQVLALSTGRKLRPLSGQVIHKAAAQIAGPRESARLHLDAIRRLLDREEPDYAS